MNEEVIKSNKAIELTGVSKVYGDKHVLRDISFTVSKGESVGIIGKNGAGKSTLLKILAGIIKPSSGQIELFGKVTSILDVGTGFHPDLSGRENINMVCHLLGYSSKDVSEKVNQIIDFSELNEHIDFPVKNYSNGMYLRLAFSIYVFFHTDILLFDEVLSVGDASFKKKILHIIHEFKNNGKTIVLVSHNLNDIINYCDRVIYLDVELKSDSIDIREVTNKYLNDYPGVQKVYDPNWIYLGRKSKNIPEFEHQYAQVENETFKLVDIEIFSNGTKKSSFLHSEPIEVKFTYHKKKNTGSIQLSVKIYDSNDTLLISDSLAFVEDFKIKDEDNGLYCLILYLPSNFFNSGKFYITLIQSENTIFKGAWHNIVSFVVEQDEWMKKEKWARGPSPLMPHFKWEHAHLKK